MQITIDTDTSSPRQMRAAAKVLLALAVFAETGADELPPLVVSADLQPTGPTWTSSNVVPFVNPAATSAPAAPPPVSSGASVTPPTTYPIPSPPPPTVATVTAPAISTPPANSVAAFVPPPPNFAPPAAVTATAPVAIGAPNNPVPAGTDGVSLAVNGGLDTNGLPWDARIHSAGQNRVNEDGTWRKRRGVSDQMLATVESELRSRGRAPAPVSLPVPPPPSDLPVPPPPVVLPNGSTPGSSATVPTPMPPPPAPTSGSVPANGPTLTMLINQMNRYAAEGRYSMAHLMADCITEGGSIQTLDGNAELLARVWNRMEMTVSAPRAPQ